MPGRTTVTLELVSVKKEVEQDYENGGQHLRSLLDSLCRSTRCYDLTTILGDRHHHSMLPHSNFDVQKKSILAFIKRSDQYMALVSFLLKNSICQKAYKDRLPNKQKVLYSLPRTDAGKPYLPVVANHDDHEDDNDSDVICAFNISHQFPIVGSVSVVQQQQQQQQHSIQIGLDIVMFDDINPQLYETTLEFMNAFDGSLTLSEYNHLLHDIYEKRDEFVHLREFYLYWAIKEAYTKALGKGLGFDFASFQVQLEMECIWDALVQFQETHTSKDVFHVNNATIIHYEKGYAEREQRQERHWEFFFYLLHDGTGEQVQSSLPQDATGCACICIESQRQDSHFSIDIVRKSFSGLLAEIAPCTFES